MPRADFTQTNHSFQYTADPRNKNEDADIINTGDETVVNSDEDKVVNDEPVTGLTEEKERGFKEGNKDDYLNEPELKDSDGQLEFPDEEG